MFWLGIIVLLLHQKCHGLELTDEQYDQMPPVFTLEEYNKCLRYDGVYCQVKIDLFSSDPNNTLIQMIKDYYISSPVTRYNHSYLEEGICVTRTCKDYIGVQNLSDPSVVKSVIEECRNASIWREYGLQARVTDVYNCDRRTDQSPVDNIDRVVLGLFLLIVLVNLAATAYDAMLGAEEKGNMSKSKRIFLCFSISSNWKYLTSPTSADPRANMFKGINCLRCISSFLVIMVHAICIFAMEAVDNTREYEQIIDRDYDSRSIDYDGLVIKPDMSNHLNHDEKRTLGHEAPTLWMFHETHSKMLFNGMHAVQMFFVISGFLLAYNLQSASEIKKIEWKVLPKIFIARFWRLTPSYAVMIAFTATWLRHLGSGPLWNKHVTEVSHQCRRYWWSHLLYVNNYIPENGYCAAHTWYSGADTQLFYLALLIHLATQNRRRNLVLGVFVIIGMILPALHVWYMDLHALMVFSPEFARTIVVPDFRLLFILGHNNMICYLCAMYAGYKMYDYQKRGVTFAGNKLYKYIYWITVPTALGFAMVGSLFYGPTPLWVRMLYQGTHRLLIGFITIWVIIGGAMKLDKYYTSFLEWDCWRIPGRLTYAVYLLHMNIVHYIIGDRTLPIRFTYFSLMVTFFGVLVVSYLIAIPFYLMVEAPLDPIMKIALSSSKQVKRSVSVETSCTSDAQENEGELIKDKETNRIDTQQTEDDKDK